MNPKQNSFTNLTFIIFAFVLLLLSFFSYKRIPKQAEAAAWVNHSYRIKFQLSDIFSTVMQAETAARGFVITKNEIFLSQFNTHKNNITEKISEIKSGIADNPEQIKNAETMSHILQRRFQWFQNTLKAAATDSGGVNILVLKGKEITDTLRRQIGLMTSTEDSLLSKNIIRKNRAENITSVYILLFSAVSILFLSFAFYRLKLKSLMLTYSQNNTRTLEEKVQERTAELKAAIDLLKRQNAELNSLDFIANHE